MRSVPAKAINGMLIVNMIHRPFLKEREGRIFDVFERKTTRSLSQNAMYWHYLGVIEAETGNLSDDLHSYFKRKLLPPRFKTILGEEIKLPATTTELSKAEMGEYLDKIASLVNIPLPDPEAAGYINEYKIRET